MLFHRHTGHHHTEILMSVDNIINLTKKYTYGFR